MKNNLNIYLISIILLSSCASFAFKNNINIQTQGVSIENGGYCTIKIWDTRKGEKYIIEQARKDAIYSILFSGIAESKTCARQPPILNKKEAQINFKKIERSIFSKNGKWSIFTNSATIETNLPSNLGNKNWKVYQVTISVTALRKYLEQENVIQSLINGF
jgi:hypothetical protein